MFKDYANYDGLGLAALVRKGEVSATELLDTAIARTEAVHPKINAVVVRHDDYARRQIQTGLPAGPFTGVPFLIKDLNYLAGTRTTSGASIYKDFVAPGDNAVSQRFLAAGVTVYGKSSSPELGISPTTERASGADPQSLEPGPHVRRLVGRRGRGGGRRHGADGARQRRRRLDPHPGVGCGLVGLKPTRARMPCGPGQRRGPGRHAIDHVVTRSVRDSAAMLDATHGPDEGTPYHAPAPERPYLSEVTTAPGPAAHRPCRDGRPRRGDRSRVAADAATSPRCCQSSATTSRRRLRCGGTIHRPRRPDHLGRAPRSPTAAPSAEVRPQDDGPGSRAPHLLQVPAAA